jgi:penicillin-binding protein 1A
MAGQGRNQTDLAQLLGSRSRASEVLKRKRALSAEMIDRIVAEWRLPYEQLARHYAVESGAMRMLRRGATAAVACVLIGAAVVGGLVSYHGADLPSTADLRAYASAMPSAPADFVTVAALPPHVVSAFLAAEDGRYYAHGGADPLAILRATFGAVPDLLAGRKPGTGATITQQLAKTLLLPDEGPTLGRKIRELVLAGRLEEALGKERILELYLNASYFGGPAHGLAAAAAFYFDKPADRLTLPEAAYLAGVLKAPNDLRIDEPGNVAPAAQRRNWVLARMADEGMIAPALARLAQEAPLRR